MEFLLFLVAHQRFETSTATQVISLGAKTSATANTITLAGYTSSTTVNGSKGADTIINSDGGDVLASSGTNSSDTYIGNAGSDTISYDGNTHDALSGTSDAGATTDGYAFNTSGAAHTFFTGATTTNKTTIAANTVAQYDSTATASTTATAGSIVAGGEADSVTGFETFIGGANADYFIANSAGGQTFDGGAGDDTYLLGTGVDTVEVAFNGEGEDLITNFTAGAGGDVFTFTGTSDVADTGTAGEIDVDGFLEVAIADATGTVALADGLTVITGVDTSADLTEAAVATFLADVTGDAGSDEVTGYNDGEIAYIVVTDGTNAGLFQVIDSDAADAIVTADLDLIATFTGLTDLTTLTADNFAGFA